MYLHKYQVGEDVFFRLSSEASKPAGSVTLGPKNWVARVSGTAKTENALQAIQKAFEAKEKEEKEPEEKDENKKMALAESIRFFAKALDVDGVEETEEKS